MKIKKRVLDSFTDEFGEGHTVFVCGTHWAVLNWARERRERTKI